MTSNDNQQYVTVEVLRSEIGELKLYIHNENEKLRNELKAEIQTVRDIAIVNSAKVEAYRDSMNIWFTVLAIVVAIFGVMATFASTFREMYKDHKQAKNHAELKEAAREVMREELPDAMRNFLGSSNVVGK